MLNSSVQPDSANLATLLRNGRKSKKWTLREAAAQTGISNGYLSLMEQGDVKAPSPRNLLSLATQYGLSYDLLMELAGHPTAGEAAVGGKGGQTGILPRSRERATGGPFRSAEAEDLDVEMSDLSAGSPGQHAQSGPNADRPPLTASASAESASVEYDGPTGQRLAHSPGHHADDERAANRQALMRLVTDELSGLSADDIAQVRAFIAGMRAARR